MSAYDGDEETVSCPARIVLVVFNVHIVHCGGWSPYGVFPSVAGRKIPDAVFVDSGLFPLNALSKNQV